MPLTVRTNGSSSPNIITAQWFNDYHDLLTGVMQDQEVTIKNVLALQAIGAAPSSAMTAALAAGSGLSVGLYAYVYVYSNGDGETTASPSVSITTTTGNQQVNLSGITAGPTGTTRRRIYRTPVGGGTTYKLVGSINDNTTTTFLDTTADASLFNVNPLIHSTFGGALILKDQTGAVTLTIANDGTLIGSGGTASLGATTINGELTVASGGNVLIGAGKIGKTTDGDTIDFSFTNDTYLKSRGNGFVYLQANGVNTMAAMPSGIWLPQATAQILTGVSGNINLFNATDGLNLGIGTPGNGQMRLFANGVEFAYGDSNGFHNLKAMQLDGGATLDNFSTFTGTGSGTYNHNNGNTPAWIGPICTTTSNSATQGYDTVTSTQCHVTMGASVSFKATAWR